jgi:alpha-D-xyloside xylohydrolase
MEQNACSNPIERREKWTLWSDEETTEVYARMARLHTRLAPYFDVLAKEAHETGLPIMRHPFLVHPDDTQARAVEDSFYLGPSLFAAPVIRRGHTTKTTWLPPGVVADLDDGRTFEGGTVTLFDAPLTKLPLFLLEGRMLLMLDARVETLAPSNDPSIVDAGDVADVLDVTVALARGAGASLTLADGTVLRASPTDEDDTPLAAVGSNDLVDCAQCRVDDAFGDTHRIRANTELSPRTRVVVDGTSLSAGGPSARRIRWTLLRLP